MIFRIFVEGPPRAIFAKSFSNRPSIVVFDMKIVKVFIVAAKEMKALNNIDRWPSKDHSCKTFW